MKALTWKTAGLGAVGALISALLLCGVNAAGAASADFTPVDYLPTATGNFTATSSAGGVTSMSVLGAETGPSGAGSGESEDGMWVSCEITGLPPGVTGKWVVTFNADVRLEVGVLNYQRGIGTYSAQTWGAAEIQCADALPSIFVDDDVQGIAAEGQITKSGHAIVNAAFVVNQPDITFSYGLGGIGSAQSTRPEVTATAWVTTWNPVSGTAVAYDNTGKPIMIQSFTLE